MFSACHEPLRSSGIRLQRAFSAHARTLQGQAGLDPRSLTECGYGSAQNLVRSLNDNGRLGLVTKALLNLERTKMGGRSSRRGAGL